MMDAQTILILAPHTDDGELGCGGTIARFIAAGKQVYYAAFSLCAKSLPAGLPADTLSNECKTATGILGIPASHLILLDFEVREFPAQRQAILEEMVRLNKQIKPDLVFIPSASDIHQDHQVIHQEAKRAFKHCSIAGYELPWNNQQFHTSVFIKLDASHLAKKVEALKAYHSQAKRNYMQEEFIRSLAVVRGVQCDHPLAEAFELYKLIR